MLCSNCGFENPTGHHFCGMCGTPLPQRPIIAPGAQSTADLTRHPIETKPVPPPATNLSSWSTPSAIQVPETEPPANPGPNYFSQAEKAESLEQFIAGFHYAPPVEEEEVTMTGAKPALDSSAKYEPPAPIGLSEEPSVSVAESSQDTTEPLPPQVIETDVATSAESMAEQPPHIATEPPPFATKGIKEQNPERSRFLDFSEPAPEPAKEALPEVAPPEVAPLNIGGPSFLGLSDTPATMAYVADDVGGRQSHWRVWTAVIVLGIFAVLGILEWRAEKSQSSNGPIGIMQMQIDRLKGKKGAVITPPPSSPATTAPAQPTPGLRPNSSGPQMQVAPQPKPQAANPQPANNHETTPKPGNPGVASNPPATKTQPEIPSAKAPAATAAKPEAAKSSPNAATQAAETAESKTDKPAKPTVPGTDELAKAASASDSAAASAWLWKAVAKGNPDAPIKLANMYIKGDGVAQSCDQALVLLRSAAAKENAVARSRLGTLYATGTCVPRNRVRAYQYMSQALEANPNALWPRQFREQLWALMTPDERQRAQKAQ